MLKLEKTKQPEKLSSQIICRLGMPPVLNENIMTIAAKSLHAIPLDQSVDFMKIREMNTPVQQRLTIVLSVVAHNRAHKHTGANVTCEKMPCIVYKICSAEEGPFMAARI